MPGGTGHNAGQDVPQGLHVEALPTCAQHSHCSSCPPSSAQSVKQQGCHAEYTGTSARPQKRAKMAHHQGSIQGGGAGSQQDLCICRAHKEACAEGLQSHQLDRQSPGQGPSEAPCIQCRMSSCGSTTTCLVGLRGTATLTCSWGHGLAAAALTLQPHRWRLPGLP